MDLVQIYQCFCDLTRLRILHLLTKSPLCVCHFQDILREPQVKISKHLAYHHIRGTTIGHSLAQTYRALCYKVVAINFLGDWGTTFTSSNP